MAKKDTRALTGKQSIGVNNQERERQKKSWMSKRTINSFTHPAFLNEYSCKNYIPRFVQDVQHLVWCKAKSISDFGSQYRNLSTIRLTKQPELCPIIYQNIVVSIPVQRRHEPVSE